MIVPMFPLPIILFPGIVVPLHIFEERYRQMTADLLDGTGRLLIAHLKASISGEDSDKQHVHAIAGLGEMMHYETLPDGRYLISVAGIQRVRMSEVESNQPYRMATYEPFDELDLPPEEEERAHRRLLSVLRRRLEPPEDVKDLPASRLADILLMQLPLAPLERQHLFELPGVAQRIAGVLLAENRLDEEK